MHKMMPTTLNEAPDSPLYSKPMPMSDITMATTVIVVTFSLKNAAMITATITG